MYSWKEALALGADEAVIPDDQRGRRHGVRPDWLPVVCQGRQNHGHRANLVRLPAPT
ncbi:MAG: hypothetical protein NTY19_49520 [Planctomycetota bacterium]|nr:hypothetical protein [Planctomycetota bacterium]